LVRYRADFVFWRRECAQEWSDPVSGGSDPFELVGQG
jgi:hypothetical protein